MGENGAGSASGCGRMPPPLDGTHPRAKISGAMKIASSPERLRTAVLAAALAGLAAFTAALFLDGPPAAALLAASLMLFGLEVAYGLWDMLQERR
jgi:hypothetical protein